MSEPEAYTAAHVQEALAQDGRVGELGIGVDVSDNMVTLQGIVPTQERRDAIEQVVEELLPGYVVRNRINVEEVGEAGEPEVIS